MKLNLDAVDRQWRRIFILHSNLTYTPFFKEEKDLKNSWWEVRAGSRYITPALDEADAQNICSKLNALSSGFLEEETLKFMDFFKEEIEKTKEIESESSSG